MNKLLMGTKLARKAHDAILLTEDSKYKQRAIKLESIGERGFALILHWNQIESALKLIRYGDSIKNGWPDKLDRKWKSIQNLKKDNPPSYELVLGSSNKSLWKIRNGIAHEGRNMPADDYGKYVEGAMWAIAKLKQEIPNIERLRDKKRRSDAQLQK